MTILTRRAPLYEEASTIIQRRIVDGELAPGTVLPNENQLSAEIGVSLGTLRRALDHLETDRLLTRKQGRGTFISEFAREEFVSRFNNLRCSNSRPLPKEGKLLAQEAADPSDQERLHLKLRPGDRVLRTRRLVGSRERVFMHEAATLALPRFHGVDSEKIGDYALSVLALKNGVRLGRASERVNPCIVSDEIAELLKIAPNALVLRLERTVFTIEDEPVEWRTVFCNMEDTVYQVMMA